MKKEKVQGAEISRLSKNFMPGRNLEFSENGSGEQSFTRLPGKAYGQVQKESRLRKFALVEFSSLLGGVGGGLSGGFLVIFSVRAYPIPTGGVPPVYWLPLAMTVSLCALAGAFFSTLAAVGICLAQVRGLLPRPWAFAKAPLGASRFTGRTKRLAGNFRQFRD